MFCCPSFIRLSCCACSTATLSTNFCILFIISWVVLLTSEVSDLGVWTSWHSLQNSPSLFSFGWYTLGLSGGGTDSLRVCSSLSLCCPRMFCRAFVVHWEMDIMY